MKRTLARFVLPIVLVSVATFAQTGNAAPAPAAAATTTAATGPVATKVGIINIQQAILLTNEGKRDLEALEKKFEPKRNELQTLQKDVEDGRKQLAAQDGKLNDDARAKMVRDIESKQKTLQRQVEDAQKDYQDQQGELVNRIGGKLMDVLDKYAKANGFSVIVDVSNPQSPVLWANASVDVTSDISTAYNASSGIAAPASTPAAPSAARPSGLTRPPAAKATTPK